MPSAVVPFNPDFCKSGNRTQSQLGHGGAMVRVGPPQIAKAPSSWETQIVRKLHTGFQIILLIKNLSFCSIFFMIF